MKVKVLKTKSHSNDTGAHISSAAKLIAACFEARNLAHKFHLQTTSYAQHVALNQFYDAIIPLVDAYAEAYQGSYGIIQEYPNVRMDCTVPHVLVYELREMINEIRGDCGEPSELQNIIDEIQALNNATLYKLTTLK